MTTYQDKSKHLKELHELTVQIEQCIRSISRMDDTPSRVAKDNLSRVFNEKLSEFIDKSFLAGQKAMLEYVREKIEEQPRNKFNGGEGDGYNQCLDEISSSLQTLEDNLNQHEK